MVSRERPIDKLIVHCSDSPDDRDIGVEEIRRWHVRDNKWRDVGYHYVIRRDGTVENGRDVYWAGAHTAGHNQFSIGICWVGRNTMGAAQREALVNLLTVLMHQYHLKPTDVYGHRDFNEHKTCPNLDTADIRKWIA